MGIIHTEKLGWFYMPLTDEGSPIQALNDISIEIMEGEFVSIVGATGAGKSTLCLALTGLIPNSIDGSFKGEVTILGHNTRKAEVAEIARDVGYVQQEPKSQLFSITVEDEIAFPLENLGVPPSQMDERITQALDLVSMTNLRKRKPTSLSGGQMQRVALAAALVSEPKVLILDEPTSALDPVGKTEVFKALDTIRSKRSLTIVMAEQESDEVVKSSDRILVMDSGKIIAQGAPDIFAKDTDLFLDLGINIPEPCEIAQLLNHRYADESHAKHYDFMTVPDAIQALDGHLNEQVES